MTAGCKEKREVPMISIKAKPVGWVLSEVLNKMYGNVRTSSYKKNNMGWELGWGE